MSIKNLKQIIFHADDFNLSPGVNRGIIDTFRNGVVRSTSILINLPGLEESVKMLKENPDLDVGLHVNLTFGSPVSEHSMVPTLLDDGGIFWRKPEFLSEYAQEDDIKIEVRSQIEKALELGLTLSHLDSHHHIHGIDPKVNRVMAELAVQYKLGVRSINEDMRQGFKDAGIPTPDNFSSEFFGEESISFERLQNVIDSIFGGFSEIMCHPGYVDDELKKKSSYTARDIERKILSHPKTLVFLQKHQAKIISYRDMLDFCPGFE